jgi:hypothetical protein
MHYIISSLILYKLDNFIAIISPYGGLWVPDANSELLQL